MAYYEKHITVPANTTEADPEVEEFTVKHGVIHWVRFSFPAGCQELTRVRLYRNETQTIPTDLNDYVAADNADFSFAERIRVGSGWNKLKIKAWNVDTTYDHTVTIALDVLSLRELDPLLGRTGLLGLLEKLLRRLGA